MAKNQQRPSEESHGEAGAAVETSKEAVGGTSDFVSRLAVAIKKKSLLDDSESEEDGASDNGWSEEEQSGGENVDDDLSPLCTHCRFLCENWSGFLADWNYSSPHYQTPYLLEKSAQDGCSLCVQLCRGASVHNEYQPHKKYPDDYGGTDWTGEGVVASAPLIVASKFRETNLPLHIKFSFAGSKNLDLYFAVEMLLPPKSQGIQDTRPKYSTPENISSIDPGLMALTQSWLEICRNSHEQCRSFAQQSLAGTRPVPTRLISTRKDDVSLYLNSEFQIPPVYCTLSHCWGQTRLLNLAKSNIDAFKKEIPREALSRTFRDAIELARELGFGFIWIDSLCIIQDDVDDWLHESALMSSVYGNSGLTIAASGAKDGDGGLYLDRESITSCKARVQMGEGFTTYHFVPGWHHDYLANQPLLTRGWVLQERLLSVRTLHFTAKELFWECFHNTSSELFPSQLPMESVMEVHLLKEPFSIKLWSWAVERYSMCGLTQSKDKLVAISGLAKHVHMQTRDQYVAGMWRKNLEYQLCWRPEIAAIDKPVRRIVPYVAPTWSWASMEGDVEMNKDTDTPTKHTLYAHVLGIQIQTIGPDLFGQVESANLTLKCESFLRVRPDAPPANDFNIINMAADFDFDTRKHGREFRSQTHYKALVYISDDSSLMMNAKGLLLVPTLREQGQYRRIGIFYCGSGRGEFDEYSRALAPPINSSEVVEICRDEEGKTQYIINLV